MARASAQTVAVTRAFQVKWIRFTVQNAAEPKTRADSMSVETALGLELAVIPAKLGIVSVMRSRRPIDTPAGRPSLSKPACGTERMSSIGTPRGRRLADLSALTIAFLICLAVVVFSWPKARHGDGAVLAAADCCEVQTAELGPPMPASVGAIEKAARRTRDR
jgi:hypothetical protein